LEPGGFKRWVNWIQLWVNWIQVVPPPRPHLVLVQHPQHHPAPVAAVTHLPQVRQRPLGGARLLLPPRQLVGHGDEEAAVAAPLVRRQREDARQVVLRRVAAQAAFEKAQFVAGFSRWVKGQAQGLEPGGFKRLGQLDSRTCTVPHLHGILLLAEVPHHAVLPRALVFLRVAVQVAFESKFRNWFSTL
jgi:hypothetical protein